MNREIYGPGDPTHQLIRKLKQRQRYIFWSLKGKHQTITFPDALYGSTYYNETDIETLKQKLIEDIDDYCAEEKKIFADLKEIINKRFGIEDD